MTDLWEIARSGWAQPLLAWGWQVMLHSAVATAAFALWSRRLRVPSGRSRRLMLVVILVLPLVTAAVPGRDGSAFRDAWALLDSARLLALPLPWPLGGVHLGHLAALVAAAATAAALWQEITPALHRAPRHGLTAPRDLVRRARRLPGWDGVRVEVSAVDHVCLATWGRPGRPGVTVSRGALEQLTGRQLDAALAHEHAHWNGGRWWLTHALFAVRLLQLFNPVALWSFREYVVETEIACDREAVLMNGDRDGGTRPLASTLLAVYDDLDRGDVAGRSLLRRRVDALLGRLPVDDHRPPAATVAGAAALLALVLPWIV